MGSNLEALRAHLERPLCGRSLKDPLIFRQCIHLRDVAVLLNRSSDVTPIRGFSGCGFELIAGLKVELGLERVDLVGGDGRDDVNEGVDDGSMLGQIEG